MVKRYRCFSGSCHEYLGSRSACHTRSNKLVVRYPSPRFIHWRLASLISKSIPLPGHPKQYSALRQGEHEYILYRYQFQVPRALGRDLRLPEPSRFQVHNDAHGHSATSCGDQHLRDHPLGAKKPEFRATFEAFDSENLLSHYKNPVRARDGTVSRSLHSSNCTAKPHGFDPLSVPSRRNQRLHEPKGHTRTVHHSSS